MKRQSSRPHTCLVQTIASLAILALTPTFYAVNASFTDRSLFSPDSSDIGFEKYPKLFSDRRFLNSAYVSFKWEIVTVAATMILAVGPGLLMFEMAAPVSVIICTLA